MSFRFRKITSPPLVLAILCLFALAYGAISSYVISIGTTLEKRFEIPTSRIGILLGANEIGGLVTSLIASYFGSKGNGVKVLTFCAAGIVFSSLVFILPVIIYGAKFSVNELLAGQHLMTNSSAITVLNHCSNATMTAGLPAQGSDALQALGTQETNVGFALMLLGCIMFGIFASPFWTVGISLVDDIAGNKSSGLYMGALFALRTLGPIIGFVVGSSCLQHHETLRITTAEYGPGQRDPRWIGAWYLGMIVFSSTVLVTVPLIAMIKQPTPNQYEERKNRPKNEILLEEKPVDKDGNVIEQVEAETNVTEEARKLGIKDMLIVIARLLTNPVYMWIIASIIFQSVSFLTLYAYLAKYLEYGYLVVASFAGMMAGAIMSVSAIISVLISGVVDRFTSMSVRRMCLFNFSVCLVGTLIVPLLFTFTCPTQKIIGLNDQATCGNVPCNCSDLYSPVCANGQTFFSACHAGCKQFMMANSTYFNCACANATMAMRGSCMQMCPHIYAFCVLVFLVMCSSGLSSVQFTKILMRQATPSAKPVALGLMTSIFFVMGMVVPAVVGRIIDLSCLYRQPGTDNCLHFDGPILSRTLNIIISVGCITGSASQFMAWWVCPKESDATDKDNEEAPELSKAV